MAVSPIEQQPGQEVPRPSAEQPKRAEAVQETRGLGREVLKKITSLDVFKEHQGALFAYAKRRTDECIAQGSKKLAELVTSTHLSPGGAEKVADKTQVNAKLEGTTQRFTEALTRFTTRVTESVGNYAKETIAAPAKAEATSAATVETKETREKREKIIQEAGEKRASLFKETVSAAGNLVPVIGPAKMLAEALAGKTATGTQMKGSERLIHGTMAVASLGLDLTGAGEVGKAMSIVGRSVEGVAILGEKLAAKGFAKAASFVTRTAGFMAQHPEAVLKAETKAQEVIAEQMKKAVKSVNDYRNGQRQPTADVESFTI